MSDLAKELFDRKDYMGSLELMTKHHASTSDRQVRHALKLNMAKCFYQLRRPDLAEGLVKNLDLGASDPLVQVDLALYINSQGRHDEAFKLLEPLPLDIPAVRFNLGWHLLRQGQFLEGFDLMNSGREINVFGSLHFHPTLDRRKVRRPTKSDRVAVIMEGGHGDCMIFARWLPLLERECASLVAYCPKSMVDLLRGMGHDARPESQLSSGDFDVAVPSMGIPSIMRLRSPTDGVDRLDYIQVDVEDPTFQVGDRLNVGIKVLGNPEFEHEQFRQVPAEVFESLSSLGDLYDFQLESQVVRGARWIGNRINSWVDTYCMVRRMDMVVSSCTSVAHLAAGMGVRVAVLTPMVPYFVWCGLPWYGDNVLELRQRTDGTWGDVVEELRDRVGRCQVP